MAMSVQDQDRNIAWLRARYQAVSRTQNRYLLLVLLGSAYTVGVRLTTGETVNVPFLGLSVPRQMVEVFAVTVLGTLALAFFGSIEAVYRVHTQLAETLDVTPDKLTRELMEEHPNLLDLLEYSTYFAGARTWLSPFGWLVMYPLPVLAAVSWAVWLWWTGFRSGSPALRVVHVLNAAILTLVVVRTLSFLGSHFVAVVKGTRKRPAP